MIMAAAAAVGHESLALVGGPACPAEARFQFGSINNYEMVEEIGEAALWPRRGTAARARRSP